MKKTKSELQPQISEALAVLLEGAPKSAIVLANYLFRVCLPGKPEEIELFDLPLGEQRTRKLRGKRYAEYTLRVALRTLESLGLVQILRDYHGGTYKLVILPPESLGDNSEVTARNR